MYEIVPSSRYRTALKRLCRHKDFDLVALERVIDILAHDKSLPQQYRDHELKGELSGIRECHVKSDMLLLYRKENDALILLLLDIGTHSSLFNK